MRFGLAFDLDRCDSCGACLVACAVENNVATPPPAAGIPKGTAWNRVYRVSNGKAFPDAREVFVPLPCQHCDVDPPPCVSVCPQNAVDVDPDTRLVSQIPVRCLGCRYCMVACPYHARVFNWWDPAPATGPHALNPDVAPRMRGVVEKCNGCHGRLHAAMERAAAEERDLAAGDWVPACVEACPAGAIVAGDLDDAAGPLAALVKSPRAFRLLEAFGTQPKVWYLSSHEWVRRLGDTLPLQPAARPDGQADGQTDAPAARTAPRNAEVAHG